MFRTRTSLEPLLGGGFLLCPLPFREGPPPDGRKRRTEKCIGGLSPGFADHGLQECFRAFCRQPSPGTAYHCMPMVFRRRFLFFVMLGVAMGVCPAQGSVLHTHATFDFHNGFWANLHHFLFTAARTSAGIGGRPPLDPVDAKELDSVSDNERRAWNTALSYYGAALAHRDLLMDRGMEAIKNELEDSENSPDLKDAALTPELKSILLTAAPIYRKHWWPRHERANRDWITALNPLVGRYGNSLITALAKIYEVPWPEQPLRVDVVAYANWAGAYTTLDPTRLTISSLNTGNQGTAALEIVFHESSHGMMGQVIRAVENAKKHATGKYSLSVWHEVLFYTTGELVAEQVPGYTPYADQNGIWSRGSMPVVRKTIERDWKPHMQGSLTLQEALTKVVNDLPVSSP